MIQQEDQQLFGASSSKYHLPDGGLGDGMRGSGAVTLAWASNHTTIIQHTVTEKVVTTLELVMSAPPIQVAVEEGGLGRGA